MASAVPNKDPKEMYALKQKAMHYYKENGVPAKMEEILNSMFYDDPPDVYGHLVNFFSQFTKQAALDKVSATQVFDSIGMPTIQTDVYCTVYNQQKLVSSSVIPSANIRARPEDREKAELEIHDSVLAAIDLINSALTNDISGMNPVSQHEVDTLLTAVIEKKKEDDLAKKAKEEDQQDDHPPPAVTDEKDKKKSAKGKGGKTSAPLAAVPDRPLEVFVSGSEAAAAVSQAVCACAATANHLPLYRHVANIARTKGTVNEFRIPLPMVTIIQCGRQSMGKVRCVKEFMVVPGVGMSVEKSIEHIYHIYHYVAKSYATKFGAGARLVNETGALCPQLDTPNQALDLLQEAVNHQGLTIGEDMHLAINAAAHDFFDFDKGRYEVVTGQLKSPDDMVDFWADLVSKYPSIIAIIDPVRGEDLEQWMKLCTRLSEGLFIIGDRFYDRPGLLKSEDMSYPVRTSGLVMNLERMNTVSDIITCANRFQDLKNEIVISTNQGDTTDTFIVDFATGLNARFLKVGGPCRGERSSKLNRLMQIARELEPAAQPTEVEEEDTPETQKTDTIEIEYSEAGTKETETSDSGTQKTSPTCGYHRNCLKLHTPFVFPLIEKPPPPENGDEAETEKEEKVASPAAKRSK